MNLSATGLTQEKSNSTLLTLSCFTAVFPHFFHCEAWVIAGTVSALVWRLWLIISGRKMPSALLLLPFVSLLMTGVWLNFQTFLGKEAGITMLVLLISCKLLEMNAKRDLYVAVYLSFFLLITGYLYNQTIFSAIFSAFSLLLLTTSLNTFQYTGTIPPLTQRLTASVQLMLIAMPLMLALFFLFPRIPGPLWSLPGDEGHGKTGLSDSLNPGNISDLALNEDIAFRVKFYTFPKDKSVLYWRGIVLDEFDGSRWKASALRSIPQEPARILSKPEGTALSYVITLEPHQRKWLFAVDIPDLPSREISLRSYVTPNLELRSETPVVSRLKYSLRSYTSYSFGQVLTEADLAFNTRLPGQANPRTREFATTLRKQFPEDTRFIQAVLSKFRTEQFIYTLQPGKTGQHAIDEFMFSRKKGFCEHYASAFTFMMRQAGIPARIVTGYQGGMQNPVDDYFEVRQSDAHAWSEVWLASRGWIRIDPTAAIAPERIHQNFYQPNGSRGFAAVVSTVFQNQSWPQYLQMYWDATNNEWNQWILGYGQQKQDSLLQNTEWLKFDWKSHVTTVVSLISVIFLLSLLISRRKKFRTSATETIYLRFCSYMQLQGIKRDIHESPTQYLNRIKQKVPAHTHHCIEAFIVRYSNICYADQTSQIAQTQAKTIKELNSLFNKIKNEFKK